MELNESENILYRKPNLKPAIAKELAEKLGLTFVPEKEPEGNVCFINNPEVRPEFRTTFAPIDILDYIYAVLYSPAYHEKYKRFLKVDFTRVPFPKDAGTFWQLVELGGPRPFGQVGAHTGGCGSGRGIRHYRYRREAPSSTDAGRFRRLGKRPGYRPAARSISSTKIPSGSRTKATRLRISVFIAGRGRSIISTPAASTRANISSISS